MATRSIGARFSEALEALKHVRPRTIRTAAGSVLAAISAIGVVLGVTMMAGTAQANQGGGPPGENGTVKIDGVTFDGEIDNEPHVKCGFQVLFFDFDDEEHANIVFTTQSPTHPQNIELLRLNNQLISDDPAGGGDPDPDEVFPFTATQLGLPGAFTPQPNQGFHVKLTIERIPSAPNKDKHKVFWVEPCPTDTPSTPTDTPSTPTETPSTPTETPSTPTETPSTPTETPSTPTETPSTPTETPSTPTETPSTPTETPTTTTQPPATTEPPATTPAVTTTPSLPTTGSSMSGILVTGVSLLLGGMALLIILSARRRTDDNSATAG